MPNRTYLASSTSSKRIHIDSLLDESSENFDLLERGVRGAAEVDRRASSGGQVPPPSRTTHWTRYVLRIWENTCRTSPTRSILRRRMAVGSSALERGFKGGDLMREDNKAIAVSLSSEGDIEAGTSGEVGNSWRPARSPEKILDTSLLL